MGIKNLKKSIQKYAPDAIDVKPNLYNKKIAIDSSILLYKFRYTYQTNDSFHIQGFIMHTIELLESGIIPVYVFDGKPPDAKKNTLDKRTDNRTKMKDRVDELVALRDKLVVENPDLIEQQGDFIDDTESNVSSEENVDQNVNVVKEIKKLNRKIEKIEKNILIVKRHHSLEVMELLEALGIPYLQAISESEETCAYLQKNGSSRRLMALE